MKKNMEERTKMVEAMEYIARHVNNEEYLMRWLRSGVADGDIAFGDFDWGNPEAQWYAEDDDEFASLMGMFLRMMRAASNSGGLHCNGVVSW